MTMKIVFFDIDGTILDHDKKIPDSTKQAVRKLKENNVHVAIATGRPPNLFKPVSDELGIDCFVSYNGSYVVYDGEVLFTRSIDMESLEKITAFAKENELALRYCGAESRAFLETNDLVRHALGDNYPLPLDVDPEFYKNNEIHQVILFSYEPNTLVYSENIPDLDFVACEKHIVDVLPKGSSKAAGIKEMIRHLGYKIENVYAFGDGANDIEMLSEVGTGIAMGNASDYVKGFADHVTTDVDDDGIYNGLKHFGLI